jgi:histidine ammonia-lyase
MAIVLDGSRFTIEKLVHIARFNEKIELSKEALGRIKVCRAMLEKKIAAKEIMYGVNTGIGEFSEVVLDDDQVKDFQKYLIYNHSAGIGEPMPIEYVRGAMAGRINVHAHGNSGCRPEITQTLVEMLNKNVTPVVCEKGSVGACGDLAPMSQIALLLMGEGEAFYNGERMHGKDALEKAGIAIPGLQARDGLSTINGSNFITAISALQLYDINRWLKQAEIAASMSLEALHANMKPYDKRLHQLRGFSGAVRSAKAIMKCIKESDLQTGKVKHKVQDAYSMRSTPQVIGTAHDALAYARKQIEIELNGIGDNPIFIPEDDLTLTGALPPFLTKGAGMFSGLMLSQYTADTLIVEQRMLSAPASIQSIPAAADQEDFVSMGMNTAIKNAQIIDNSYGILGIEFMAAAQALDFRDHKTGNGVAKAKEVIRRHVEFLDIDRPLYNDHNNMKELVKSCEILEEVEKQVGSLE